MFSVFEKEKFAKNICQVSLCGLNSPKQITVIHPLFSILEDWYLQSFLNTWQGLRQFYGFTALIAPYNKVIFFLSPLFSKDAQGNNDFLL